uniref:Uncharacterized protein n=1 Tax=Pseudictyota dubia TaxID=2749911 RepID=A0A7R9YXX1_9STRA|mmetsp:Transcript_12273/g.23166  ORF Transcript_12273/g.23166 Transcript_12273/m.23166 type:complete len:107 (+) Transcript_12273:634-954(+)
MLHVCRTKSSHVWKLKQPVLMDATAGAFDMRLFFLSSFADAIANEEDDYAREEVTTARMVQTILQACSALMPVWNKGKTTLPIMSCVVPLPKLSWLVTRASAVHLV